MDFRRFILRVLYFWFAVLIYDICLWIAHTRLEGLMF